MAAATENKVWASTVGSGAGLVFGTLVLWLLGVFVWGAAFDAPSADVAVSAVPGPVKAVVLALATAGATYFAGWRAKHTPRPEESYVPKRALVDDSTPEPPATPSEESYSVPEYDDVNVKAA